MAVPSCALLSNVPIAHYQECFKSLIAFNPDEPRAGSMAGPPQTHTRTHKRPRAPTRSLAILAWRLKPYKGRETKVKPPSFKWQEHGLTKWAGEPQKNKRMEPGSVRRKQSSGQRGWGAGPLIKRIIWRRTAQGRSCPCPRWSTVMKPITPAERERERRRGKKRAKDQRWKEGMDFRLNMGERKQVGINETMKQ